MKVKNLKQGFYLSSINFKMAAGETKTLPDDLVGNIEIKQLISGGIIRMVPEEVIIPKAEETKPIAEPIEEKKEEVKEEKKEEAKKEEVKEEEPKTESKEEPAPKVLPEPKEEKPVKKKATKKKVAKKKKK